MMTVTVAIVGNSGVGVGVIVGDVDAARCRRFVGVLDAPEAIAVTESDVSV